MVLVLRRRFGVLFLFLRYKSEAGALPIKTVLSANLISRVRGREGAEREREREREGERERTNERKSF